MSCREIRSVRRLEPTTYGASTSLMSGDTFRSERECRACIAPGIAAAACPVNVVIVAREGAGWRWTRDDADEREREEELANARARETARS